MRDCVANRRQVALGGLVAARLLSTLGLVQNAAAAAFTVSGTGD
jgi:hypothetical protein